MKKLSVINVASLSLQISRVPHSRKHFSRLTNQFISFKALTWFPSSVLNAQAHYGHVMIMQKLPPQGLRMDNLRIVTSNVSMFWCYKVMII